MIDDGRWQHRFVILGAIGEQYNLPKGSANRVWSYLQEWKCIELNPRDPEFARINDNFWDVVHDEMIGVLDAIYRLGG